MSSGLQDKMYHYEVAPPAAVWNNIAAELDQSELSDKYPSRLYNIQIAPPLYVWQSIAATLDEAMLVEDFAGKLGGIAVAPPAAIWDKIKTSLDTEHEAAIPEYRKFSPFLKYAAAAAIIGFLAWGGVQLFNNKSGDTTVAKQATTLPEQNTETATTNKTVSIANQSIAVTDVAAALEEARNDAALEASKKTYAKLDVAATNQKIKNAADFYFSSPEEDDYQGGVTRGIDINQIMPGAELANRYILLMTPDGNIIRMSKKLSDLVCCVAGEDQDKDCIDQMKRWREKIADPSAGHSPGNFMDILHLINSLQDK